MSAGRRFVCAYDAARRATSAFIGESNIENQGDLAAFKLLEKKLHMDTESVSERMVRLQRAADLHYYEGTKLISEVNVDQAIAWAARLRDAVLQFFERVRHDDWMAKRPRDSQHRRCSRCALHKQCTTGRERRVRRWEHEAVLDKMQRRLDRKPGQMRIRRRTIEHVFGTLKLWMGPSHFLMRTLPHVRTEMSLQVLAYNLKRVMQIFGIEGTMK